MVIHGKTEYFEELPYHILVLLTFSQLLSQYQQFPLLVFLRFPQAWNYGASDIFEPVLLETCP